MVKSRAHGWAVFAAMTILAFGGFSLIASAAHAGNPTFRDLGVDSAASATQCGGNMEGKEARFGIADNLGKKLDSKDIRWASLYILMPAFSILVFTAVAAMTDVGRSGIWNAAAADVSRTSWKLAPHGLAEVLYAHSAATGNNGSAFAGLTAYSDAHPIFHSLTLALAMFLGRFPLIIAVLAIAGNLAKRKLVSPGPGSFPVTGPLRATAPTTLPRLLARTSVSR